MLTYIFRVLLPSLRVIIYAARGYLCIDTPCCEVKLQILVYMAGRQRILMNEGPFQTQNTVRIVVWAPKPVLHSEPR